MLEKIKKPEMKMLHFPVDATKMDKLTIIAKEQGYYNRKEFLEALFDMLIAEWESDGK
jgi:hypothetical protein